MSQNNLEIRVSEKAVQLPSTFAEAIAIVEDYALQEMQKEIDNKQLYFHNIDHVKGVKRRANKIFKAIKPSWGNILSNDTEPDYLDRMELTIGLCALAHDMIQDFLPETDPHAPRRRETGVSEIATIDKLIEYIETLNEQIRKQDPNSPAIFRNSEIQTIREAIEATICLYDPTDGGIYQRDLYNKDKNVAIASRIIALADIGALGIEGIDAFKEEGSRIFLEENPDVVSHILKPNLKSEDAEIYEDIRQRLLKRTRFQIRFAKARVNRYSREVEGLPADAIPVLTNQVFKYLNSEVIKEMEATTPTEDNTTLEEFVDFFKFKHYLGAN